MSTIKQKVKKDGKTSYVAAPGIQSTEVGIEEKRSLVETALMVGDLISTAKLNDHSKTSSVKLKTLVTSLFGNAEAGEGPVTIIVAIVTNLVFQRKLDSDGVDTTTDSLAEDLTKVGSAVISLLPKIFSSIGEGGFSSFSAAIGDSRDFERSVELGLSLGLQAAKLSNRVTPSNDAILADPAPAFLIKNVSMAILYTSYTLAGYPRS